MLRRKIHSRIIQFFKHIRYAASLPLRKPRPIRQTDPTHIGSLPIELALLIQADPPSAVQRANWLIALPVSIDFTVTLEANKGLGC